MAAVSGTAYDSLVRRDPARLSGNLPQILSVFLGWQRLLQVAGISLLAESFAGHANALTFVFADAAPELNVRDIKLRLLFAEVLVK